MARFERLAVYNAMIATGLVPVFYHADGAVAKKVLKACDEAGVRVVEFTNRGDGAIEVFKGLEAYCRQELPGLILGVGSIIDPATAALFIAHGANFIVGPCLNTEVARLCNRRKIAYSPGCATPTEISLAEELGCEIIKIFPGGQVGGPAFVKALRGPCPWTSLMPTGGVDCTEESLRGWFEAGVVCVGMGSRLISRQRMARGEFEAIKTDAARVLRWIAGYRPEPGSFLIDPFS